GPRALVREEPVSPELKNLVGSRGAVSRGRQGSGTGACLDGGHRAPDPPPREQRRRAEQRGSPDVSLPTLAALATLPPRGPEPHLGDEEEDPTLAPVHWVERTNVCSLPPPAPPPPQKSGTGQAPRGGRSVRTPCGQGGRPRPHRRTADPVQEGSQESPQTGGRASAPFGREGGRDRASRAAAPLQKCRKQRPGPLTLEDDDVHLNLGPGPVRSWQPARDTLCR
ncbi:2-Acylglycerol O-Acyltransferase 1, partial [Manis pentadactyla]